MASAGKLTLRVVTPDRLVLEEQVDEVVLPGHLGALGILPDHTPLLSRLGIGRCEYLIGREHRFVALSGGFVEVGPEHVTVLADEAYLPEDIDLDEVRQEIRRAQEEFDRSSLEAQDEARLRLDTARAKERVASAEA